MKPILRPAARVILIDRNDRILLLRTSLREGRRLWITPGGAQGNRSAGIGVQFADTAEAEQVKNKIETFLAGTLDADKPTHTM